MNIEQYIQAVRSAAQYNYRRSLPEPSRDNSISSIFKLCAVCHSITTALADPADRFFLVGGGQILAEGT